MKSSDSLLETKNYEDLIHRIKSLNPQKNVFKIPSSHKMILKKILLDHNKKRLITCSLDEKIIIRDLQHNSIANVLEGHTY